MKGLVFLGAVALGAASLPTSATAATIVQQDNELLLNGFDPFNSALGSLNSVTLQIDLWRPRAWLMVMESTVPLSATADWTVDGYWRLPGSEATGGADILVPLTGSGTADIALSFVDEGMAAGIFGVHGSGGATVTLNLAAFLGDRITFNGFDPGFFSDVGDTTVTVGGMPTLMHLSQGCPVGDEAYEALEDYCGTANYTLTYDYTPAVPEPGTWAMLLIGFAGVGIALRRRRVPATA